MKLATHSLSPQRLQCRSPKAFPVHVLLLLTLLLSGLSFSYSGTAADSPAPPTLQNASVNAQLGPDEARFAISAEIKGRGDARDESIVSTLLFQSLTIARDSISQTNRLQATALRGDLRELALILGGEGSISRVSGEGLEDWSLRETGTGSRSLVLRFTKSATPRKSFQGEIHAVSKIDGIALTASPLTFTLEHPALATGFVRIITPNEFTADLKSSSGLIPIDTAQLPDPLKPSSPMESSKWMAYRFLGTPYSLPLSIHSVDPELDRVVLSNFQLTGDLGKDSASFTLTATARVRNPKGGTLDLLSGLAALTAPPQSPGWRLQLERGRYVAVFDRAGDYPLQLQFNAAIQSSNGWNRVQFQTASTALQPIALTGLNPGTQFRFLGAARPEPKGDVFHSFLPPGGSVDLSWKQAKAETEGTLFFAVDQLTQAAIKPGMLRQTTVLQYQITQGELNQTSLLIQGPGEITRVQGASVLGWKTESIPNSAHRRIRVQFNQPQRESFAIVIQTQSALTNFPASASVIQLHPEGATRTGGHFRLLNEGAVKLEILDASGLSQISPTQFPQTENSKALGTPASSQVFAYRYSGGDYTLQFQADNILPELSVSQLTTYHLGETELVIESELELEVREAPLREWVARIPRGFSVARLEAAGLADSFVTELAGQNENQLRAVYTTPVEGRQVIHLRLERNSPLGTNVWTLPRLEMEKARSSRGQIAISADPGFRTTPAFTPGLTEIATAFFPRKSPRLQSAFRLTESNWQARLNVERLPQSVQVDALHLFSVGEGIAYGSSLLNFAISGAPLSTFRIALTNEYFNVEFTGKDIRNWQRVDGGYAVQLHAPVSGTYTLLATYERPFKPQGETLRFVGAQPLDTQSEQGHTVIVSTYQFQVQPTTVSPELTPLEPGEIPAEYRLLFDAPILAAYRYTSRPFTLQLALQPLAQKDSIRQLIERASILTRISKDGQAVTEARYFLKSQDTPNLRVALPTGAELWTASVNGADVVPMDDGNHKLIPLSSKAEPNAVQDVRVKLAARSPDPRQISIATPSLGVPILLADWRIEGESGQRIRFVRGPLLPSGVHEIPSLLQSLRLNWTSNSPDDTWRPLVTAILLWFIGVAVVRIATHRTTLRYSLRHVSGGILACLAFAMAFTVSLQVARTLLTEPAPPPTDVRFVATVLPPDGNISAVISNLSLDPSPLALVGLYWPVAIGLVLFAAAFLNTSTSSSALLRWCGGLFVIWGLIRQPHGASVLQWTLPSALLLALAIPSARSWWKVRNPPSAPSSPSTSGPAVATAILLFWIGLPLALSPSNALAQSPATNFQSNLLADSTVIHATVSDGFVRGKASLRWQAKAGDLLPFLHEPGVLTHLNHSNQLARLVQLPVQGRLSHALVAQSNGWIEFDVEFQVAIVSKGIEHGFTLPVSPGLVHRLFLVFHRQDTEITTTGAVSIRSSHATNSETYTHELVLAPTPDTWIGWRPRARDTRLEPALFYADWHHLIIPTPGVLEGVHQVQIRPAQGELTELIFETSPGSTVTDVASPLVSLWRFDPSNNRLRVHLSPPQSRSFSLSILSQSTASPLPYDRTSGLLRVLDAAAQTGLTGIATGSEVQLESVSGPVSAPINLEDFPKDLTDRTAKRIPGLTLRRAFRQETGLSGPTLRAVAVEADVRAEVQQTLSLAEDRTVLAATLKLSILRAGIFKFSFPLPQGLEVESISGNTLSHWTETKSDTNRWINLHLKSRTEGRPDFSVSLAGPGIRSSTNWSVPKISVREATKQVGQLMLVPEQGLRLQIGGREGVTQQDPQQAGIRQKGVLLFRVLQSDWRLTLDLERVDAWTQVTSLQQVSIDEARVQVQANLQYEIENAGLKSLRVRLPRDVEGVRFRGDSVADFASVSPSTNSPSLDWEIKLHRRVNGRLLLHVLYSRPLPPAATNVTVRGIEALDVNLQRGFLSVQSANRLQLTIQASPNQIQPSDTQTVPRALSQDLPPIQGNTLFRVADPSFIAQVQLHRHGVARVLPARVERLTLTTVPSHDGALLTRAEMVLIPGDRRMLPITLPKGAEYWSAFVGGSSARSWREADRILIPLEQPAKAVEPVTVEFYFSSPPLTPNGRTRELALACPQFDLPLENIRWHVYLDSQWEMKSWKGGLQFEESAPNDSKNLLDVDAYIERVTSSQKRQSQEAAQYLTLANSLLEKGDPENARRAFQNAYGLSQHDMAFNEDARVQLHNLKTQQALVGLNFRQSKVGGETRTDLTNTLSRLRSGLTPSYTQKEARQLIERNSPEDNAVQMRLVERLIQQQEATSANPTALQASLPEIGTRLSFSKSIQIGKQTELNLLLQLRPTTPDRSKHGWVPIALIGLALASLQFLRHWVATPIVQLPTNK